MRIFASLLTIVFGTVAIASQSVDMDLIDFKVSGSAIVLPTTLVNDPENGIYQTCVSEGVNGPRVRLRSSLEWKGEGQLVPLVASIEVVNSELNSGARSTIGSAGHKESISYFFGAMDDYIEPGVVYSSNSCFLDFGSLPHPKTPIMGNQQLLVPVTVSLFGVVRLENGLELPFFKTVNSQIVYAAGSVPYDQSVK